MEKKTTVKKEKKPKTKEDIIKQCKTGDITLSFTALSTFAESPRHFIAYKTGEKKSSPAMALGSLEHMMVLEPDEVEKHYILADRSKMPFPNNNMNKKENKQWKIDLEEKAATEKKILVTSEDMEKAVRYRDLVRGNQAAMYYIEQCTQFERGVKYEVEGFKFRGYIDANCKSFSLDLKKNAQLKKDKLFWMAKDRKLAWQAYLYNLATAPAYDVFRDFYFIITDGDQGVLVLKISWNDLNLAKLEIEETLRQFRRCIMEDRWDESYEFWKKDHVYTLE